jgi:hypothetical protein
MVTMAVEHGGVPKKFGASLCAAAMGQGQGRGGALAISGMGRGCGEESPVEPGRPPGRLQERSSGPDAGRPSEGTGLP